MRRAGGGLNICSFTYTFGGSAIHVYLIALACKKIALCLQNMLYAQLANPNDKRVIAYLIMPFFFKKTLFISKTAGKAFANSNESKLFHRKTPHFLRTLCK